ncbi:ATP-dependent DNA helicase RecG [Oribacterium sp. KHPX15]|uniref:DEAD/DEAH box helicase n=1 Tax=Oribacterium sp. KHPX15 TaxID=1855342 RepID=UPI00089B6C35|nr:DEAD/DEAH box helicase [Oribacterium sp. KHPX15]SEA86620.1 ATP-dependent DNA helicase RecG [Oribacterium sp. KHPX15]
MGKKTFPWELTKAQLNTLEKNHITNKYHYHRLLPLHYMDNTVETGVSQELNGCHVTIIGRIIDVKTGTSSKGAAWLRCTVINKKTGYHVGVMNFFATKRVEKLYSYWMTLQCDVLIGGELSYNPQFGDKGFSIVSPDTFTIDVEKNMVVKTVLSSIKGISEEKMRAFLEEKLKDREEDTLPEELLSRLNLDEINEAVRKALFPSTMKEAVEGRKRLLFNDILNFAGRMELEKRDTPSGGIKITKCELTEKIIASLPYELTNGQRSAYESIKYEMMQGNYVNALVQGDVGCGKTIISFLAMLLAAENGFQAVLLAPTKILAKQHYDKLLSLIKGTSMSASLIVSDTLNKKGSETDEMLREIANGNCKLIVGTHSVMSDRLRFKRLGLSIVDEEHRFGVEQREAVKSIDYIGMSATPIPRTLATAIYGDTTKIFSVKEKPGNRKGVRTLYDNGIHLKKYIQQILDLHQQIYVVCPMIVDGKKGSTTEGVLSTEKATKKLQEMFPDYRVEEMTGVTSNEETDAILNDFHDGKVDILVSTTVIEVGVDVPNATLILIMNAERFGLSQMHQLRGRVGRGDKLSFCVLVSKDTENENIKTLLETDDGFEIAEKDLKFLRKSGDLFGSEQSGRNKYIDEIVLYPNLYKATQKIAAELPSEVLLKHIERSEECEIRGRMRAITIDIEKKRKAEDDQVVTS